MRRGLAAAVFASGLLVGGCRLSLLFVPLSPPPPRGEGDSLLIGSIYATQFMLLGPSITSLSLRRKQPWAGSDWIVGTVNAPLFAVARGQYIEDGDFLLPVSPGVYQLEEVMANPIIGNPVSYSPTPEAALSTRIVVTAPAIYDMGMMHIDGRAFAAPTLTIEDAADPAARAARFADAIRGSPWERFLPAPGAAPPRRAAASDRAAAP